MHPVDPIIFRELSVIHKIIEDEAWLEGERRGRWVSVDDPVVRAKVCDVVLRIGAQMREEAARAERFSVRLECERPSRWPADDTRAA